MVSHRLWRRDLENVDAHQKMEQAMGVLEFFLFYGEILFNQSLKSDNLIILLKGDEAFGVRQQRSEPCTYLVSLRLIILSRAAYQQKIVGRGGASMRSQPMVAR
jgi:hypothetical protein